MKNYTIDSQGYTVYNNTDKKMSLIYIVFIGLFILLSVLFLEKENLEKYDTVYFGSLVVFKLLFWRAFIKL